MNSRPLEIALVHLVSFGDCLYATIIARQIKADYPNCVLTWVIGDKYASLLKGNPHVDHIQEIEIADVNDALNGGWTRACIWVEHAVRSGKLDKVFYSQLIPKNAGLYDGYIRSTTYATYGRPISPPHRPVLCVSEDEEAFVASFASSHRLETFKSVFLFECEPRSNQSPMNSKLAEEIAHAISEKHSDVAFILSSRATLSRPTANVIEGRSLSYRENAILSRYCTGLIGCSSGITWLTTSSAAKMLPMLQVLSCSHEAFKFASVAGDFERYGLDSQLVIEMGEPSKEEVVSCLQMWLEDSHAAARHSYHRPLKIGRKHAEMGYYFGVDFGGILFGGRILRNFITCNGFEVFPWGLLIKEPPAAVARLALRVVRKCLIGSNYLKSLLKSAPPPN